MKPALDKVDVGLRKISSVLSMGKAAPSGRPLLHTTALVYIAVQVALLSFVSSYYNFGVGNATTWVMDTLDEYEWSREYMDTARELMDIAKEATKIPKRTSKVKEHEELKLQPLQGDVDVEKSQMTVFTAEQLSLFDGTRPSRPVYLAILGRVYDVENGRKHYGKGGGYHFFSGKDASRAFVTGDFTPTGLIDDVSELPPEDLLGIKDWVSFYDKDYKLVGVVQGRFYDADGKPTEYLQDTLGRMNSALEWRAAKAAETEVFPPCNSEWHKDGGRVWCSTKSGGVQRDWTGVPRILEDPSTKDRRCACVKNFGKGLSSHGHSGRGDLAHPFLSEYPNCSSSSNSCKIDKDSEN